MNYTHQKLIVGLLKAGQDLTKLKRYKKPKIILPGAYPDYGKSIVARRKETPAVAGIRRAISAGTVGAIAGTLIARILSPKTSHVLTGTALGGLAGAIPGYISGRDEALSNYSKLLFLRRLGIRSLGELGASQKIPGAWRKTLRKDMI